MSEFVVPKRFRYLAPIETELVRVGRNGDGGYVISPESLEKTEALVSLGLSTDWSFDTDFLNRRRGIHYRGVDRSSGFLVHLVAGMRAFLKSPLSYAAAGNSLSVASRFLLLVPPLQMPRRRRFLRKWVRPIVVDKKRDISLSDVLHSIPVMSGVFLKIDIEGGEYELLPEVLSIAARNDNYFSGICVEFHDVTNREAEFHRLVQQLQSIFAIVHVHANNFVTSDSDFPIVVEMSFAKVDGAQTSTIRRLPRPGLDFPNNPYIPEIELSFE